MKTFKLSILLLGMLFFSSSLLAQIEPTAGDGGEEKGCIDWWIGDCGPSSSIYRDGDVHIGGSEEANSWAKFQVTGKTFLGGELRGLDDHGSFIIRASKPGESGGIGSYIHMYGEESNGQGDIGIITRGNKGVFRVSRNEGSQWFHNFIVKPDGEMIGRRSLQLNTGDAIIPLRVNVSQWGEHLFAVENDGKIYGRSLRIGKSFWNPDWDIFRVEEDGKVTIGNAAEASDGFLLSVAEGIQTQKVKVCADANSWCDYVFAEDYPLNSIETVAAHIKAHKHLPNVPSAQEVEEQGINVAEMDATLLRQIEELWLHVIDLKKENEVLKSELEELKK